MLNTLFKSLFADNLSTPRVFIMMAFALLDGIVISFILSFKIRSRKGFFITVALIPSLTATAFAFINVISANDSVSVMSRLAAVAVGLGLIRFRSAQGSAEEMLALFSSVVIGSVCGFGFVGYALVVSIALPLLYILLSCTNLLKSKKFHEEKLLKITIPENLEYNDAFTQTFSKYLKEYELVGVKTTGMGSMFRLSYRIIIKNALQEKQLIDELRIKNGNLEISLHPYTEDSERL